MKYMIFHNASSREFLPDFHVRKSCGTKESCASVRSGM